MTEEAKAIGAVFAELAAPRWRPAAEGLAVLPHPALPPEALSLRGLRAVAGLATPVLQLERLDALARNSAQEGTLALTQGLVSDLGGKPGQAEAILRALGFVRIRKADSGEPSLWRRRSLAPRAPTQAHAAGPPAAPAAGPRAKAPAIPSRRARRRRARRRAAAAGSQA